MPLPVPLLDDLDWDELTGEARDRIPANAPSWTDHNAHDPGITIVDLLAWLVEQTNFSIDQIPDRHRERFAALLGEQPAVAAPATAVLELTGPPATAPAGLRIEAHTTERGMIPFVLRRGVRVTAARVTEIATATGEVLPGGPADHPFEPLGPDGTGAFTITFGPAPLPGPYSLWVTAADEPPTPRPAAHHEVGLGWEFRAGGSWKPLANGAVADDTAALTRSGFVVLTLHEPATTVRCRAVEGRYERAPRSTGIVGNATIADQVETRHRLGVRPDDLTIDLESRGVQRLQVWSTGATTMPTFWRIRRNPLREPDAAVAVFSPIAGRLRFSDGRWGRRPLPGESFDLHIDDSLGAGGDVGPDATWTAPAMADVAIGSPWGATGGAAAERPSEAIARAAARLWAHERLVDLATARDVDTLDGVTRSDVGATIAPARAVTALDYERLALGTPGVHLARARAWVDLDVAVPCAEAPGTLSIVVVPYLPAGRPVPTPRLIDTVRTHLLRHRTLGTRLRVHGPDYTAVEMSITLSVLRGADPERVRAAVDRAVRRFLDPLVGGPCGEGWPFGRDVYRTEIMTVAGAVEGVDLVTDVVLGDEEGCSNLCVEPTNLVAVESLAVEVSA